MIKLEDSQIWESARCIIQIQLAGKDCFGFKGIIFEKDEDKSLKFNNVLFNEKNRLEDFIKDLNMKLTKKRIITKERENVKRQPGLGKYNKNSQVRKEQ